MPFDAFRPYGSGVRRDVAAPGPEVGLTPGYGFAGIPPGNVGCRLAARSSAVERRPYKADVGGSKTVGAHQSQDTERPRSAGDHPGDWALVFLGDFSALLMKMCQMGLRGGRCTFLI